jgi:peptidoglycan/xylan/chitin deacetylase (PgdA/CDA1 family)
MRSSKPQDPPKVMLSFSVLDIGNPSEWCINLSCILEKYNTRATIFITGIVADQYPNCVSLFGSDIDVGSQTYDYIDLSTIIDYTVQLEEVTKGKEAVDRAGNLNSRLFRAPFHSTDQNIYSLLTRANITADFSYEDQYNIFLNDRFMRFSATTYDAPASSAKDISSLFKSTEPVICEFSNVLSTDYIENYIKELSRNQVQFVNASDLAGFNLTERA